MSSFEETLRNELKEMREDIREIHHEVTKYKGFVGGIVWSVTAVLAALQVFYNWMKGANV